MIEITNACENKKLFIELFNRYTIYAPYSLKIDEKILDNYILKPDSENQALILIGRDEKEQGIIHFCRKKDGTGLICLLFADSNKMALELSDYAENWFFSKGIEKIYVYYGWPNPYQYILHGSEMFCWAGNYHANNAFKKLGYDLELDVLVMSKKLTEEKEQKVSGFEIKKEILRDDDLALSGRFNVYKNNEYTGHCGYHFLKAISCQYHQKLGQLDIWLNDHHGTGLANVLLSLSHNALFKLGVEKVILATNQALFRAIKFYEKNGYSAEPVKAYVYSKEFGVS